MNAGRQSQELLAVSASMRTALLVGDTERAVAAKDLAQGELRMVMSRTERLAVSSSRDGMLSSHDDLQIALILDLARDVAHGVARPAAPLSAFAAGLVAGRAGGTPADTAAAVAAITALAKDWGA